MKLSNRAVLIILIGISAVLRFYNYSGIPFMHDEFSAIFRTEFNTFRELVEKGIKPDGHPAGVQVFLYFWINLFGRTEWVVKLPFTLMGVFSVWLLYLVAKKWYNETVALVCAAFFASIQYTIMYSQIARPYISGLFFSLAMVYFWQELLNPSTQKFWKNGIPYVLASALCAYNHHFSLLFAAITGISGLFFIPRKFLYRYMLSGLFIFILYIPHLGIFMYQLKTGGVGGWLAKPESSFFTEYLYYIFNYSLLSVFLAVALFLFGIFSGKQPAVKFNRYILSGVWFLLPLVIGYWYSIKFNAVLQYSVLIFSFFPLFFLLFGHIPSQNSKTNLVLVLVILAVNTFTLISERRHYRIFYNSAYEHIVTNYIQAKSSHEKIPAVIDSHKKITHYYLHQYQTDSSFTWFDAFPDEAGFITYLRQLAAANDYFYFGAMSFNKPNTVPIIQQFFPVIEEQKNYFGGTTYLFSKKGKARVNRVTLCDFNGPVPEGWHSVSEDNLITVKGSETYFCYRMDSLTEWSPTFSIPLSRIISHENNFIDIAVDAKAGHKYSEVLLVATLESEGKVHSFSGAGFNSFYDAAAVNGEWMTIHHSLKLADINLDYSNLWLKIFVWNKGKDTFLIDNFRVTVREGNPIIYGLYEKIPSSGKNIVSFPIPEQ